MRIVTNPGSNLPAVMLAHYGIAVAPQQIVVDGVSHDTRDDVTLARVDEWVRTAKEHPYVIGTTAAELATLFTEVGRDDEDILAIMTSRKIISSYDAAVSATRTLAKHPRHSHLRVRVVDTTVSDLGAGMICVLAGEAIRAGLDADATEALVTAAAAQSHAMLYVHELDNLVKGGRASFLRVMFANMLGVRPVLAMRDGELVSLVTIRRRTDPVDDLVQLMRKELAPGCAIWLSVAHAGRDAGARAVVAAMREHYDVRWHRTSAPASSIYLHTGPGAIGLFALRVDALPWVPTVPPSFA